MKKREPSSRTTWGKAFVILAVVIGSIVAAVWFRPDRTKEARECAEKCKPRWGDMVPDPRFKHSFKGGLDQPRTCVCS
jgi:hypothetical protein